MKITNQRRANLRKRFVLFTLIAAMLITLVPAANVSAASAAYLTEDPNADPYPFPLDMNFLSKYLYGSAENTKGTVATYYAKEVPNEWLPHEMPASLKTSYWGKAVVHTTKAKVYFYPGTPSINYHKKRMDEINKTAYSYLGGHPDGNANLAFYCAETSEFKVLAYDATWVAIWSNGAIDVGRGLTSTCGGLGTEQYASWKPGVYFIPRKDVYITDARNQQLDIPTVTASGTATCNIYIKTTPASDNYVTAGLIETNQLFQITKSTPINGHYQIYYRQGLYYVNAKYVNLRMSNENKPAMQYNAVVTCSDRVNITTEANASSSVEGIAKKDAKLQVVKKNYGNGYSQVWFNSKKCYIPTKNLTGFETYLTLAALKKPSKAKGTLVIDSPWAAYGANAFTEAGLKILKKYHMDPDNSKALKKCLDTKNVYFMQAGESAPVYKVSKMTYSTEAFPDYKETGKLYKILYNGEICYVADVGNAPFTYYPGNKYSKKVKAETKVLRVYCQNGGSSGNLECYKINGQYYYKLDDIAYLMSKTNKSFHVKYDKTKDAMIINSMTAYKGKAASLKKGNGKKHKVTVPATSIVWDGEIVGIPCYKIDGKYYVSPDDIGELTDSRFESDGSGWCIWTLYPHKIDAVG